MPEKDQLGLPFARLDKEEAIRGLRDDLRELLEFLRHDSAPPRGRGRRTS